MTKSNSMPWQWDEFQQTGTDYGDKAEVDIYDKTHASFRDSVADSIEILDTLEITGDDVVIDFGAGTGTFVIQAAKRCSKVHAVDVSQAMLDFAESRATQAGLSNVRFHLMIGSWTVFCLDPVSRSRASAWMAGYLAPIFV